MKTDEVVRAWKDADYRDTLAVEHRAELPEHPAGAIEFEQPELEDETLFVGGKGFSFKCPKVTRKQDGC